MSDADVARRVPIVLLAAGAGERYGGIKQLALINGEPMLRHVARRLLEVGAPLVVVTGAHAAEVETALTGMPVAIERHVDWAEGMGSSLAAGIRHVAADRPDASGTLLCLADQPLLDIALLRRMLVRHRVAADAILVATRDGTDGPPVLFPRNCFGVLAQWSGTRGARALLAREAHRVQRFATASTVDVDTPADLQSVRDALATRRAAKP